MVVHIRGRVHRTIWNRSELIMVSMDHVRILIHHRGIVWRTVRHGTRVVTMHVALWKAGSVSGKCRLNASVISIWVPVMVPPTLPPRRMVTVAVPMAQWHVWSRQASKLVLVSRSGTSHLSPLAVRLTALE